MTAMQELPFVSIIIPAFNAAECIAETIESVRAQTFQNFETIIVDDGSTDETAAVAKKFWEADSRFFLIRQSNQGVSVARNAAIKIARGEWIAFLDADDVWLPQKLERQLELLSQNPDASAVFTNFYMWDGRRDLHIWHQTKKSLPEGDVGKKLIFNVSHACAASMSTALLRRELFQRAGLFDPELSFAEDWDLLLRMAECGLNVRTVPEPLARYRRWANNITNQKLKAAESDVRVLEKNFHATKRVELRPLYEQSLAFKRAQLELVRARRFIDTQPDAVANAIWRAWRFYPRETKWLARFAMAAWPNFLGGFATKKIIHRKLIQKF